MESDVRSVHRELRSERWLGLVDALHARPGFWWLDSALPGAPLGRWSYAGAGPWAELRAWGDRIRLDVHREVSAGFPVGRTEARGDPLAFVERILARLGHAPASAGQPPFGGGAVGWWGHELCPFTDGFAPRAADDLGLPDLCLLLVDRVLACDHLDGTITASVVGYGAEDPEAALLAFVDEVRGTAPRAGSRRDRLRRAAPHAAASSLERPAHEKAVQQIRDAIDVGDVYQVCLTRRVTVPFDSDPWEAYLRLRRRNPAPFGAYLAVPEAALLCSSPERFLCVSPDGAVESRPIKGTRPRGGSPAQDAALARALGASEKDRAENVMIVDLVRNDLGRVCESGTVHVPELRVIERYATVWQMVSTIRGRLRSGLRALDPLRATFPPGSMTGAPKRAALRILDGLEPVRRGPYAGALGWIDPRGAMSLAVVIRTAIVGDGRAHVHTGGGIVADSSAAEEWRESVDKARILLECLAESGREGAPA